MKIVSSIFKSLYSNQAAIDARKNPWWVALIIAVFSIFLPWIPYLSSGYTANVSSILTATSNYEIDKGFKSVLESDYFQNGITIAQKDGKYVLSYNFTEDMYSTAVDYGDYEEEYQGVNTKELVKATFVDTKTNYDDTQYYNRVTSYTTAETTGYEKDYYYDCISVDSTNTIDPAQTSSATSTSSSSTVEYENSGRTTYLQAYYFPELSSTEENYSQFLTDFASSAILQMTSSSSSTSNRYPHSYTIWGKDFILLAVYPIRSTKSSISVSSSYSGTINEGFNGSEVILDENNPTTFFSYLAGDETNITTIYTCAFATFLHEAGRPAYLRSVWINIGILSAIVAGSILVASLILLLVNKRKSSIYRDANYFNSLNEAIYLMLTPSLLGMIFGFFASSYVMVVIIGAILFRVVFSINKICPPPTNAGGNGNKPLYQARS